MPAIVVSILGVLGPLFTYLIKLFINGKVKAGEASLDEEKKRQFIEEFKEECLRAVKKVDLEFVLSLKIKGEFSAGRAAEAKLLAIEEVKIKLGPGRLLDLAMFFSENAEGLMKLIGDTVEQAIIINKKEKAGSILLVNPSPYVHPKYR